MSKISLFALVAIILFGGCTSIVSYPVSNPKPFQQRVITGFEASSRDYITRFLGQPHLKLKKDKIWIYGQSRITWERVPPPHEHEYFALMISFDKGLATGREIVSSKYQSSLCWSNDMCLEGHWIPMEAEHGPKKLDRQFSALTSGGSEDQSAKLFRPDEAKCSIYVFKSFDFFQLPYPPAVTLGSFNDEPVPAGGYLFVKVEPGSHRLQASNEYMDFQCNAGDLLFYAVSNRGFVSEPTTEIEQVSDGKGQEKIRDRKILVTW